MKTAPNLSSLEALRGDLAAPTRAIAEGLVERIQRLLAPVQRMRLRVRTDPAVSEPRLTLRLSPEAVNARSPAWERACQVATECPELRVTISVEQGLFPPSKRVGRPRRRPRGRG
ncbi:MAG: hypothetical protein ACLFR7_09455 [Opitutales bacterium]